MDHRDKILEFVKIKGPVLPGQISKLIGMDTIMASAHLAELTATGKLKISTLKFGGSPLYFLKGQEAMLQKFIEGFNDKEKKAYDLLNEKKVLRDSEQEPVIRVALREIKDFALPLNVKYEDTSEIFWKWHTASDEDAEKLIKLKIEPAAKSIEKRILEEKEIKPVELKPEIQKPETSQKLLKEKSPEKIEKVQKELKETAPKKPKLKDKEDDFQKDILGFFDKNKITVISSEVIKKDSEIDFILEIPSVMGSLQYYCKAKNKKRISDSDLSNAYVKGQFKKLPVIVLSPGELSAKAQELINKELKNLTFKRV